MAGWQFTFPASRACLWDATPTGPSEELHISRNSWVCVRVSCSAVQLAVRHARQVPGGRLACLLIASAWVTEDEGVAIEVDRFDPGRSVGGRGPLPTALIPGDIAIPCQVMVGVAPESYFLPHNLSSLQTSLEGLTRALTHPPPLNPTLLLSLRIHCTCSEDSMVHTQCVCVMVATPIIATPLRPIPVVQTALARNLSGPLPLSTLQSRTKHGYLTMESSRKLVMLLHSDPQALALPLVGVWVSGVSSVSHPLVWTACCLYCHAPLRDRVWGEGGTFLLVVYAEGGVGAVFWECRMEGRGGREEFSISSGEATLQLPPSEAVVSLELHPAPESSSLHTLLTASHSHSSPLTPPHIHHHTNDVCDVPLPSPHPTPSQAPWLSRDSELSCLSLLEVSSGPHSTEPSHSNHGSVSESLKWRQEASVEEEEGEEILVFPKKQKKTTLTSATEELLWQQERQLRVLQEQVSALLQPQSPAPGPAVSDATTNTGQSLLWPHPLCSEGGSLHTETSMLSQITMETNLDLHSFAHTSSPPPSPSLGESASIVGGGGGVVGSPASLLFQDERRFYQNMLAQVNELLQSQQSSPPSPTHSPSDISHPPSSHTHSPPDTSHPPPSHTHSPSDISHPPPSHAHSPSGTSHPPPSHTHSSPDISISTSHTLSASRAGPSHQTTEACQSSTHWPHISCSALPSCILPVECAEVSLIPVPRIMCPSVCVETSASNYSAIDHTHPGVDHTHLADMIALKYLGKVEETLPPPLPPPTDSTLPHMSMATEQYLHRHHLLTPPHPHQENILDIQRLKTLPKLI